MAREQSYPTIWELSDDLWEIIKILLDEYDPPASTGRPRDDRRPILTAVFTCMSSAINHGGHGDHGGEPV
jgi:hypothetical protein